MAAPVTGRLSERIRSLCRLALVPTGLEISGPFADWPQCPLAWGPWPAPGHDRAWFHPRCKSGPRRSSTEVNTPTLGHMARGHQDTSAISRARYGPAAGHPSDSDHGAGPLCRLASVPTGLVAPPLVREKVVPGHIPAALSNSHASAAHSRSGRRAGSQSHDSIMRSYTEMLDSEPPILADKDFTRARDDTSPRYVTGSASDPPEPGRILEGDPLSVTATKKIFGA